MSKKLILLVIAVALFVFALSIAIAYGAYWLTLAAGAPQYVAVIVGIAVWLVMGLAGSVKK